MGRNIFLIALFTKVLSFERRRLALSQKLDYKSAGLHRVFLLHFKQAFVVFNQWCLERAGSQIVLGILQSNSYLRRNVSGPLVVLLQRSRRECSCSWPSAGITRMY